MAFQCLPESVPGTPARYSGEAATAPSRRMPLRVVAQRVEMRGRSLWWLLDRLDKRHTYYISGQMVVGRKPAPVEDIDLCRPVSLSGKMLRLHYAREEELEPFLELVAAEGEVYVQIWLKPGDAGKREVIPGELAGYL